VEIFPVVIGCVSLQRLAELGLAARNTRRLRARGAIELDRQGYPLFPLLHGAWVATMLSLVPAATPPSWSLLILFGALQMLRCWAIAALGRHWTTRVLILPDTPLVRRGPYRFCRHPNYLVVIGEIAILPLTFGAIGTAIVFSVLNLTLLSRRIAIENRGLAMRTGF